MKKFFLGLLFAADELNVVNQEQINCPVFIFEFIDGAGFNGGHKIVGELLAGDISHPQIRRAVKKLVADGLQKMGLAQAHAAV